jgi:septum formation protein
VSHSREHEEAIALPAVMGDMQEVMGEVLLLASASPRRRTLLEQIGVRFTVVASDLPEKPLPQEAADQFVQRMARDKALAVAAGRGGVWVLAADTVVVVGDEMLGKPSNGDEARRMLARLSGVEHRVLTGVVLVAPDGSVCDSSTVSTTVRFRAISEEEIDAYVASGEPLDKAGAYAIQGAAARFVEDVFGSYTNVVGLPLDEVRSLLHRHGLLTHGGPGTTGTG